MSKLIVLLVLFVPSLLFAQSPFDGTWKAQLDRSIPSSETITFFVSNGIYDCTSCIPEIRVQADSNDQPISAASHETIAVSVIDSRSVSIVFKRDGKTIVETTRTASEDGQTLRDITSGYPREGCKPVIAEVTYKRVREKPEPSANQISGSWKPLAVTRSENGLLVTFKMNNDELSVSTPTGFTWTAKIDGKESPVQGSYATDSVSIKRIDDRTIEADFKVGGHLVRVDGQQVSVDGMSMTTALKIR